MSTGDLRGTVPAVAVGLEDAVQAIYKAMFIGDGVPGGKPSVLQALEAVKVELAEVKAKLAASEAQRLTWKNGIGLTAAGGILSQIITYAATHMKGGQ